MKSLNLKTGGKVLLAGLTLCAAGMAQTWQFEQPLPAPGARYGNGAVTGPDGNIYVVGGTALSPFKPVFRPTDVVSRYDHGTWTANYTNLKTARTYHATVVGCDGKIVALGGTDVNGKATNTVEAIDVSTNQRSDLPNMPQAHARLFATVGPDCNIYAVSDDADSITGTNQVEVFNVNAGTWLTSNQPIRTLPVSVNMGSPVLIYSVVTSHNGHIVALATGTEFDFNPSAGTPWQEVAISNNVFDGPGYVSGNLYPVATATLGVDSRIYALDQAYLYSIQYPSWLFPDPTSKPGNSKEFAAATSEGRIYTLGGSDTDRSVASYGPLKASLGQYKFWWDFRGTSSPYGSWQPACVLTGFTTYYNRVVDGRVNFAANFDATHNFSAPAACADFSSGDFSIEFWMKQDGSGGQTTQAILDKRSYTGGYHGYHVYFSWGAVGLQLANENGAYANYTSNIPIPKDQWTHVAITVDSAHNIGTIWVNGVVGRTFPTVVGTYTSSAALNIGGHNFGGLSFKGQLDELAGYNRALTFQEIRSIVLAGSQGKQ
jgi:hypothetical protein